MLSALQRAARVHPPDGSWPRTRAWAPTRPWARRPLPSPVTPSGCFFYARVSKNKYLDQNYLRTMKNMYRPYFVLRAINFIGCILLLLQADDETTCLGLHTCFMVADLAGTTSACCSIDSFLRIRCSLLFWVWDKAEGHHLGCKYCLSCFMSFSLSWLQSSLFLTRLLLATIGLWEAP